jgi:hypothetical protein
MAQTTRTNKSYDVPLLLTHWLASPAALKEIDCLCLGTGRFLRSVLVPALAHGGYRPALIQTRGRTFLEYMSKRSLNTNNNGKGGTYEIDTVLPTSNVETTEIPCWGAFSLGRDEDKEALVESLQEIQGYVVVVCGSMII